MFVDGACPRAGHRPDPWAGQTVDLIDPGTGEVCAAQIFVAAMGASNDTGACPRAARSADPWAEAAAIGTSTAKLVALILESRPHPEQGYRASIGILRLARHYGADRPEAACECGLDIGARSYGSIQSILKHGLDRRPPQPVRQGELLPDHSNIRGSRYYH
jgi:hypothetical protein